MLTDPPDEASPTPEPTSTMAATPEPTPAPSPTATPIPSAGPGEFVNPVIPEDFPDPHVLLADGTYYAYATTGNTRNLQAARSADLTGWESLPDMLPQLASWSGLTPLFEDTPHKATWAPGAARIGDRFVLYYTTPALEIPRPDGKPSQCVSVASADVPEGPFIDESDGPLVCQPDLGGSIDATHFQEDDGTNYLIWKNDGNCCAIRARFFIQELSRNGLELVGVPTDMGVANDEIWEGRVIEAPTLIRHDGTYYLFYSGNDFGSAAYAVGYATSQDVLGPYTDAEENPILASEVPAMGPGHQSVFADDDGDLWMSFHAWDVSAIGYGLGGQRAMWIDELVFEDGRPVVMGPDVGPQPVP